MCLQENLEGYVQKIFEAIVYSGLTCPITMCEVFYALREAALKHFPGTFSISPIAGTFVCTVTCSLRIEIVYVKSAHGTMFKIECKSQEWILSFYRSQRSCGKVMFSQASVILFTGAGGVWQKPTWANPPGHTPP